MSCWKAKGMTRWAEQRKRLKIRLFAQRHSLSATAAPYIALHRTSSFQNTPSQGKLPWLGYFFCSFLPDFRCPTQTP